MILVTGATGTIGSLVVKNLLDMDVDFRAGVHSRRLDIAGVETCTIDYDRPETLPPALEGIRTMFLLSRDVSHEAAMVEAAHQAGVERIVYLSSFRADRDLFLVGQLHHRIERQIKASGMDWTIVQPSYLMQNFITISADDIRNEDAFYDSIGDTHVSRVDARDVAGVLARVLTENGHSGKIYELTGPSAISHHDTAAILSEALGREIRYVELGDDEFRNLLLGKGVPPHYTEIFVNVNRYTRTRDTDAVLTSDVEIVTGQPPTSFARFCRDYAPDFAKGDA